MGGSAGSEDPSGSEDVLDQQEQQWTSVVSQKAASSLHCELLAAGDWGDSADLLLGGDQQDGHGGGGLLTGVLDVLQPRLNKWVKQRESTHFSQNKSQVAICRFLH